MAKKTKDTATATTAKIKASADPVATQHLVRLLNILALLLAIAAFLLQFFAVITHHWKYQLTSLQPILSASHHRVQAHVYDDSRIDQSYGLFSRGVKVYANNDQQLNVWASTRFPRLDNEHEDLHQCLSQTHTLRGSLLTCANRLDSPGQCHCRRYPHWNAIIFFEITALIFLGLVVVLAALLTTQYHGLLKPIGVVLSFLAFLFLLIGLILLLSYLKRETRTIADSYPHVHSKIASQVGVGQRYSNVVHKVIRRQVHETYRAYQLLPGQHPYNDTHFQQYSQAENTWVYIPYSSVIQPAAYAPRQQGGTTQRTTTAAPLYNSYGPLVGYDQVYEHTRACIGWSTVLSIIAMIIALILPLILAFSWLTQKKLGTEVKTVTTTTVKTEYVPVPHDATVETVPLTRHDNHGGRQEPTVVHDVVIRDVHPTTTTTQTYRT
jgi:hypothetical protein